MAAAERIARSLAADEHELDVALSPSLNPSLAEVMWRWAGGADLADTLRGTATTAGDLVREARQVAELIEQIAMVADDSLSRTCAVALAGLNRGVVIAELPAGGVPCSDGV